MRGKRKTTAGRRVAKDVPQFAPNFTVYVLPPDVVCLYSEDRKFFLHGELFCALASAIGKGGRSLTELVGDLGTKFPPDKVQEALKQLIERRYIVPASASSTDATGGYWASLGLPPGIAEQNLGNCRVRIQTIDVKGGAELGIALGKLGVRVVTRSQDLTVTLVNDYLEPRLAELNQQRVSDGTSWLLVQPSGAFPLVGPVFTPGKSACWSCLFDRMIRNREIKGFLDRAGARAVAVSPLARNTLGQGAIEFAAVEIAKAIATGFRTELNDHIQLRFFGFDGCQALRGATSAMSDLRQQKAAGPAPEANSDRDRPRRQAGDDQRRLPDRIVARHRGALQKARQPPQRRRHPA